MKLIIPDNFIQNNKDILDVIYTDLMCFGIDLSKVLMEEKCTIKGNIYYEIEIKNPK